MALNLWKIGGKPLSYNPLPSGYNEYVSLAIGDYVAYVRAKSLDGATLNAQLGNGSVYTKDYLLSVNSQTYIFEISNKSQSSLFFRNRFATGNIIIEDIQLVQKPLPKLTINGIDGFNSGKWTLHANARVIDDETLELNATATDQISDLVGVPVVGGSTYTFSMSTENYVQINSHNQLPTFAHLNVINTVHIGVTKSVTFTTPTNATHISIRLRNATTGKFTFKKPMLNLGTIPAPYEKKRGERMVLPSVKGNYITTQDLTQWGKASVTINPDGEVVTTNTIHHLHFRRMLESGKTYTFSFKAKKGTANAAYSIYDYTKSANIFAPTNFSSLINQSDFTLVTVTFTVPLGSSDIGVYPLRDGGTAGTIYIKDFMLNEGTTAQPYEPYAVQLNKKPKRYVPKKNLFDGQYLSGQYVNTSGALQASGTNMVTANFIPVIPNKSYTLSISNSVQMGRIACYDANKNFISILATSLPLPYTFVVPNNAYYVRYHFLTNDVTIPNQLEQGTLPTPYEPYQLVLPRAKSGLEFEGQYSYLQFPSMTMDSIEIDCLIDSQGDFFLLDTRTGYTNGWVQKGGIGSDITQLFVDGISKTVSHTNIPYGTRSKMKFVFRNSFTDDVNILSSYSGGLKCKGTLYKVTCYLNGQVVATYDFENPQNIVGDKVIPNAKNLIPSFDDSRWSLHANFKVLGKDVLKYDSIGSSHFADIVLDVKPNTNYLMHCGFGLSSSHRMRFMDVNGTIISSSTPPQPSIIVPSGSNQQIKIRFESNGGIGTFDFIKPQLYELSGKEGTIVGKPTPLRKAAKGTKYRKR